MTAIVTTPFRVVNAENFKSDVGSQNYYIGIGKGDAWSLTTSDTTDTTPFTPVDRIDDIREAYQNMSGLKKVTSSDVAHVVPRNTWTSGTSYIAWDSDDASIYDKAFYVITSEYKVYKCIVAGGGSSTIQPVHTTTAVPAAGSDGYVWKYMYTVTVADAEKFLTISYMPVQTLAMSISGSTASTTLASTHANYPNQSAQVGSYNDSNAAGIERIEVTAGGSNYSASDVFTVTIDGDGTGATVVDAGVTVSGGGAITAIALNAKGTNYTIANITITHNNASGGTAGSGATARAVLAPKNGHGTDPVSELGGFYIGLNVQLVGTEDGDIAVGDDFRQVALIKNPTTPANAAFSASTGRVTRGLQLADGASLSGFTIGEVITSDTGQSGAKAYLTDIDTTNKRLYYYQNSKTGYKAFATTDTIKGLDGTPSTAQDLKNSSELIAAEVQFGSGQLIFLENRDPVSRSSTQTEDIKLIIEF